MSATGLRIATEGAGSNARDAILARRGGIIGASTSKAVTVDLEGRAQDVGVEGEEGDEIPPAIRDCVERLVASAPFDHDPAFERTTSEQVEVEP